MRNAQCAMNLELIMKNFWGYFRTLRNYLQTPKARHDFKDYACAGLLILLTALIVALIIRRLTT